MFLYQPCWRFEGITGDLWVPFILTKGVAFLATVAR
jgi:hypothetical protein